MEVKVEKYTDIDLLRRACEMTTHDQTSNVSLKAMYKCEHSPIRTQMFWIELLQIPTFVSVHFARHKHGVEHFVTSNRDDRGGTDEVDRETPINHGMWINAQALINMSRKRLCNKSHKETVQVMKKIKEEVAEVDPDLSKRMVPDCVYRGQCYELKKC